MAGGRPLKTTADFPEDWENQIFDLMKQGGSLVEVYVLLDISDKTARRLMKADKQFFRTIKKGQRLSEAWWIKNGRTNIKDKDFNYTGWYMNMKNRFGWRDQHKIEAETVNTNTNTNIEFEGGVLPQSYVDNFMQGLKQQTADSADDH